MSAISEGLVLRDGTTASIRRAAPDDAAGLHAFFERLSPESRRRRFFTTAVPSLSLVATLCENGDPRANLTLLVTRVCDGELRIIATASYHAKNADAAEVAFAVDDAFNGLGLATLLLENLALEAVRHGFTRFWAVTQADNRLMLGVFRDAGFAVKETANGNEIDVNLSLAPGLTSHDRMELRHRAATVASLRPFFRPRGVAVIGASRSSRNIGRRVLTAMIHGEYQGTIHPVNPKADEIAGLKCYTTVGDIPEPIDLAVIAVPAKEVSRVIDECAAKGVRALIIISAGFAEVGHEGAALQHQLIDRVRGHGMRMIGPNCLGVLTTAADVRLNASFSPIFPEPGRVAVSSDSGALGLAVVARAACGNLGISACVSVGNRADVSSNDLLEYWESDDGTDAIVLYLESFGNPRRFARIARRVSRSKPVIAVKAGRSGAGSRAASSHTAALAASDNVVDALFHQVGVIRAPTLADVLYVAEAMSGTPLPRGRRVGILTNAGGPAILCTDACEAANLQVPELSEKLKAELRAFAHPHAGLNNPVDLVASATPADFRRAVGVLLRCGEIDALIVLHITLETDGNDEYQRAIRDGVVDCVEQATMTPVLASFLPEVPPRSLTINDRLRVPCFPFPESAARTLGHMANYAEWKSRPPGVVPELADADVSAARSLCRHVLAERGPGWLSADESLQVLRAMGLPLVAGEVARDADAAVAAAERLGFPVAVKLASRTIVHKTDVGGVHLNLHYADAVRRAVATIESRLAERGESAAMDGVLVQKMAPKGIEVVVGVTHDPLFGPVVAFGLGGVLVELLKDVTFRVTPLTDRDAGEMIASIRGRQLLDGFRGHPPGDVPALQELLLRIAKLADEVPEVSELDLNPVFVLPPGEGCAIADVRLLVRPAE